MGGGGGMSWPAANAAFNFGVSSGTTFTFITPDFLTVRNSVLVSVNSPDPTRYGIAGIDIPFYTPAEVYYNLNREHIYSDFTLVTNAIQNASQVEDIRRMLWENWMEELWYA
jgi:hypothetical protein